MPAQGARTKEEQQTSCISQMNDYKHEDQTDIARGGTSMNTCTSEEEREKNNASVVYEEN